MGRKRKKRGSMSSYFRTVFREKPEWLRQKSNDEIIARYRADHSMAADADVGKSVKQTMANVKSILRKASRQGADGRRSKATSRVPTDAMANYVRTGKATLENLEELIDECLVAAKGLDREGLDSVIRLLRHARNTVVWKLGQK